MTWVLIWLALVRVVVGAIVLRALEYDALARDLRAHVQAHRARRG